MINAAIVGLGRWGQVLVNSVQDKSDKIRFTAGVTRTVSKAEGFAKEKGFTLGGDYAAVLADPEIDAVALATPHSQHAEQIVQAAAAGKHVFVEKPFTLTAESARASVAAMEKAGLVLALGHCRRFMPSRAELKKRIDGGALGTVLHAETNMSNNRHFGLPADGWRASRDESPAGGMAGMGIHMIDTLIGLCGRIADVHCISQRRATDIPIDDTTCALFRFENGMTAYLGTMGATAFTQTVKIFGTKGSVEIRDERYFEFRPTEGETETIDFGPYDKERAELEAFADAVTGGPVYPLPASEAIHGIEVFETVMKAAGSGVTEKVG